MRVNEDISDIIYARLKNSLLMQTATGELYKEVRPNGSTLEDVVINVGPLTGVQRQIVRVNVNIYVPDLPIRAHLTAPVQMVPNVARMAQLSRLALAELTEEYGDDYLYELEDQLRFSEPETGFHYANLLIRMQLFSL